MEYDGTGNQTLLHLKKLDAKDVEADALVKERIKEEIQKKDEEEAKRLAALPQTLENDALIYFKVNFILFFWMY